MGNVGIGTATPSAKFHIVNQLPGAQADKTILTIWDLYNAGSNGQYMNIIG